MKRFTIILLATILYNSEVKLQEVNVLSREIKFSGYFENQFFPQEMNDEVVLQDYNKLRFNMSSELDKNLTFNANVNYTTYHGKTSFNLLDFIPEKIVDDYASSINASVDSIRPFFDYSMENNIILDNAYLSLYTKHLNLRIGKQQLPWGSGYAWNPTDIFNVKNIMDPTYEKVGVNAFKAELPFLMDGMITGIISVEDNWVNTTKAIKVKKNIAGFDLSGCYVNKLQTVTNYETLSPVNEKREMIGADASGSILGIGFWAEGAYNFMEHGKEYGQYVFGTDYTFNNGLYFMLEYYRNELGKSSNDEYTFNQWMNLMGEMGENLGRDYIYLGQMFPVTELINWSNFLMINLNDGSGMVFPWFDISINDNTELILVGYIPFGKKETEFGEFGKGGFARIRAYF